MQCSALRVDNRLDGLLALGSSATGGGYGEDELEVVRLAMRQLAATLALAAYDGDAVGGGAASGRTGAPGASRVDLRLLGP